MEKYLVKVTEVLQRTVLVDAENADAAKNLVRKAYRNEDIILDYSDFNNQEEIECVGLLEDNADIPYVRM